MGVFIPGGGPSNKGIEERLDKLREPHWKFWLVVIISVAGCSFGYLQWKAAVDSKASAPAQTNAASASIAPSQTTVSTGAFGTANLTEPHKTVAVLPVRQQSVSLKLEGKERPIALFVTAEFKSPSTPSEVAVRDRQLTTLNSNLGRRTRYCDWMVYDWNTPEKMPWLMVASIGGLIKHQGKLPESEWKRLKAEMPSLQGKNLEASIATVERRIQDGAKVDYEITKRQIRDLFVSDSSSVTCIVDFVADTEFGPIDAWGAMKLLYTDRSIATVYVYVPKEYPDALGVLQGLVQRVSAP